MSTVGPAAVARLGDAAPRGTAVLDAPVLGSLEAADAIAARSYPRWFPLSLARKDASLIAEAAHAAGVAVPASEAALGWLAAAEASGAGASDYSALLETILQASGP
jgi:3-hydroxyisobutyrate dehydrogenase-like beta-hydroxyacid dehydrogenase